MKKRLKKQWKRLLAGALSAVMLAAVLPAPAYAAVGTLVRNSALENSALMQALDDAEQFSFMDFYINGAFPIPTATACMGLPICRR